MSTYEYLLRTSTRNRCYTWVLRKPYNLELQLYDRTKVHTVMERDNYFDAYDKSRSMLAWTKLLTNTINPIRAAKFSSFSSSLKDSVVNITVRPCILFVSS